MTSTLGRAGQRAWWAAALGAAGLVAAQPAAPADVPPPAAPTTNQPAAKPARFKVPVTVTRADLGAAYLDLDRAIAEHPLQGPVVAEVNKAFDGLTAFFFAGNFSAATQRVHDLTRRVLGQSDPTVWARVARSLKAGVEPPVVVGPVDPALSLRLTSMYAVDGAPEAGAGVLRVGIVGPQGTVVLTHDVPLSNPRVVDVRITDLRLPPATAPGRYRVTTQFGEGAGSPCVVGTFSVVPRPLARVREEFERALASAAAGHPDLALAIAIARSRTELLVDDPSESNSAEFLADPVALTEALTHEITAINAGMNPYKGLQGDWWLQIPPEGGAAGSLPARVFAPIGGGDTPRPLVIALHGAGGDENMFMDGYGHGLIKQLASQHGFIAVSPRTEMIMSGPKAIDRLVEVLGTLYRIDSARVYVVGHSMGAMTAATLGASHASSMAGVACIAGGPFRAPKSGAAPMRVYGAQLDTLIPASRLEGAVRSAKAAGKPVDFELVVDWGHTLCVSEVLPRAVEWLLSQRLGGQAPKP